MPPAADALAEADLAALHGAAASLLADDVAGLLAEPGRRAGLRVGPALDQGGLAAGRASEGRMARRALDLAAALCVAPTPNEGRPSMPGSPPASGSKPAWRHRCRRASSYFEAQAALEQEAEDLDYDDSGRLRFSADLDAYVNDAKGASQAVRMSDRRSVPRRYRRAGRGRWTN